VTGPTGEGRNTVSGSMSAADPQPDGLARAYDPEAFEEHPIEQRSTLAAIQWAARRHLALQAAARLRPWLAEHDRQVAEKAWDEGYDGGRGDEAMDARGLPTDSDYGVYHGNPYRVPESDIVEPAPDICPECGKHNLTSGDRPMSHADWLRFEAWMSSRAGGES